MALVPVGTPDTKNIIFNQGVVTINGNYLANVSDLSITTEWTEKILKVLGTLKGSAIRRADFKCGFKAKVTSLNADALKFLYGSSATDGSGMGYSVVDGQQTAFTNICVTTYIGNDTTQPVQWQFTNAIIKSFPFNLKVEDYAEGDIEVVALDVYLYDGATVQ